MLLFGGRKENLGTTFTKLKFLILALHSMKQKNMKREELERIENCVMVLFGPLLFVKITILPFLKIISVFSISKYTAYLSTV